MKERIKKYICYALIILCFTSFLGSDEVLAGMNKPSDEWTLVTKKNGGDGKYKGSGECNTVDLYSNYNFTGVSKMKITVKNNSSKKNIKVKVYKNKSLWDSCVSTVEIPANGKTVWTINTTSSAKYYVRFLKPADFSWNIKKG